MLATMRRIDVVAPRAVAGQVVRAIHRAGVVHLVPFEPPIGIGSTTFAGSVEEMPATTFDPALQAVGELEGQLGRLDEPGGPEEDGDRPDARSVAPLGELWSLADGELLDRVDRLRSVRAEVERLTDDRLRLGGEIARLDSYRSLVGGLQSVLGHLPSVRGYATTGLVVDARYRAVLGAIGAELERVTGGRCEVVSADIGTDRIGAVLIYPQSMAADVRGLLGGRDIEEVSLPDDLVGVPFEELGPRLTAARDRLTAARAEREAGLASLRTRHGPEIAALRLVLGDRIAERRALAAAGASDHLVVLSGWLPDRDLAGLRDELAREVGSSVEVIERTGPKPTRDAPVALQNLPVLRAFEPLASFTVVPRYGSLDPTPLLALALPAFIGLMVGDAGYGFVLLALLALIRWRRPRSPLVRRIWPIGLVAAVSTIGFGILFGEWFGDAGATLFGIRPVWLDRREAVDELLVLAIAIGIGQVGLGLVLGIVNSALMRRRRELAGRATLLVCAIAILVAIASLFRFVPEQVGIVAVAAAVIALVLLVLAVGLTGPIEVVGVLGNVLSYARLMAIGVASVMLGLVANRLGGLMENAIAGLLVAGAVHALNFVLGFFDASVQGVRLQYVEFFTKFVEPGGVRYAPFVSVLNTPAGALRRLPGGT
jgi:V/A-type H+/Na+-transporting ATPase subunit I